MRIGNIYKTGHELIRKGGSVDYAGLEFMRMKMGMGIVNGETM